MDCTRWCAITCNWGSLQVHEKCAEVEQRTAGLQLNQQINIALRARTAPSGRPEDPHVAGSMTRGNCKNDLSLSEDLVESHTGLF
jgi:hypothetical protein